MRVTSKSQVTIPRAVRDKLGIRPNSEVEFVEDDGGQVCPKKSRRTARRDSRFGAAATSLTMTTDEITALTRNHSGESKWVFMTLKLAILLKINILKHSTDGNLFDFRVIKGIELSKIGKNHNKAN